MSEITSEGIRAISSWMHCNERVTRVRSQLSDALRNLAEAEKNLAEWMLPSDAKPGEKIALWFGDSLIQVEFGGVVSGDPNEGAQSVSSTKVTVRSRGKHFGELCRPAQSEEPTP